MKKQIVVENYLDLITSEHSLKEKFVEYNKVFLNMVKSGCDALYAFDEVFKLNTAKGDALDKLAAIAGTSRILSVDDPDIPASLPDSLLRLVIKSKIAQNHWNGTMQGWNDIMQIIFPDSAYDVIDNFDMTVSVTIIDPNFEAAKIALLLNGYLLPKPSGVKVNYIVIDRPLFGWDTNSQFIKGWDDGVWISL